MAVINIDDAYILNETGAQVDKVTGLFTKDEDTTSGEKAFAQLNIGTAGSNRNLLDNPWWGGGEVVNQRSADQLNPSEYGIDRWKGGSRGSVSVTSTGLAFGSSGGNAWQPMESALLAWMVGKVFTASVLMSDGTIYSGHGTYGTGTTYFLSNPVELFISSAGNFNVRTSSAATVRAVKLELGSVSTLANDAPPDYGQELAKCQRYFYRMKSIGSAYPFEMGFATSATNFRVVLPTHCSMRTPVQSVTMNGGNFYAYGNGVAAGLTSVSYTGWVPNGIVVTFTTSGLTAAAIYALMCNNASSYIDISCDI